MVELLVTAGLMVLIMFLFAQIFQIATGTMSTMKGIAENDQRARTLTTVIKNDLKFRTFRDVLPYQPNEGDGTIDYDLAPSRRRGYFYIAENNPADPADDVLQFTVEVEDDDPFYGRARRLGSSLTNPEILNQPDFDDNQPGNLSGTSTVAEVSYFLRAGKLYRSVLLIRPRPQAFESAAQAQPQTNTSVEFFDPALPVTGTASLPERYGDNNSEFFWRDFDYSAHFDYINSPSKGVKFNGLGALSNEFGTGAISLGSPLHRFGHNHANGQPREFIGSSFIGRFTLEERSHSSFRYPHLVTSGNPMEDIPGGMRNHMTLSVTSGVVDQFRNGPRRAEDILMTNVIAFDIQVLDEFYSEAGGSDDNANGVIDTGPAFVNIGHGGTDGLFQAAANNIPRYGARNGTSNNVFDTWGPEVNLTADGIDDGDGTDPPNGINDPPPFYLRNDGTLFPSRPIGNFPLRAIRISILYHDLTSQQIRQLTLVESLVD